MKKFCNNCGNQLELSQRFCIGCGAVNPFFISAFTFLSDQSDDLEKLRIEKERIDKELAEKEEKQAEFVKQEKLRKQSEETEKLKLERQENERLKREFADRGRLELNLKEEIMRVKEETAQHQKETIDLVKEVREELQQLDEDNKRLRAEIAAISHSGVSEQNTSESPAPAQTRNDLPPSRSGIMALLIIVLLGLGCLLAYVFIFRTNEPGKVTSGDLPVMDTPQAGVNLIAAETPTQKDTVSTVAETGAKTVSPGDSAVPLKTAPVEMKSAATPPEVQRDFVLSEGKLKRDIIGKKISGCGIIIANSSEIKYVRDLVLVEKLSTGNLKYKFTAGLSQENETYTAMPYVYYSPAGAFIKIDGTNCE